MTEESIVALVTTAGSVIVAIIAATALIIKRQRETMSELIEATRKLAHSEGMQEERDKDEE